jgi:peptidoglycan/LPS O-acetylase OafA/YrhL
MYNYIGFGIHPSFSLIVLNLAFVYNFTFDWQSSMAWAGWTLSVEMIFYAMFPLVIGSIKTLRSAVLFMGVAVAVSAAAVTANHSMPSPALPVLCSFPTQLQFFAAGIVAYFLFTRGRALRVDGAILPLICFCVVALSSIVVVNTNVMVSNSDAAIALQYGAAVPLFLALCVWQSVAPSWIFANRFVVYWGERSFSIYLLHIPILIATKGFFHQQLLPIFGAHAGFYICGTIVISLTLVTSWITYRFVERPGMRLGAWLENFFRVRDSLVATATASNARARCIGGA